jgi:hypothetical protein
MLSGFDIPTAIAADSPAVVFRKSLLDIAISILLVMAAAAAN